jgi:hypothetical protein
VLRIKKDGVVFLFFFSKYCGGMLFVEVSQCFVCVCFSLAINLKNVLYISKVCDYGTFTLGWGWNGTAS